MLLNIEKIIKEVIYYGVLNGGKCLCFYFVYVMGCMMGVDKVDFDIFVVVIECIYSYLLVYDDLLVMDDDDLRCGCFICYIVYGEV